MDHSPIYFRTIGRLYLEVTHSMHTKVEQEEYLLLEPLTNPYNGLRFDGVRVGCKVKRLLDFSHYLLDSSLQDCS
mgnify:CR=1 FL=1